MRIIPTLPYTPVSPPTLEYPRKCGLAPHPPRRALGPGPWGIGGDVVQINILVSPPNHRQVYLPKEPTLNAHCHMIVMNRV